MCPHWSLLRQRYRAAYDEKYGDCPLCPPKSCNFDPFFLLFLVFPAEITYYNFWVFDFLFFLLVSLFLSFFQEEQQRRHEEQIRTENLLQGNPLLQYASTATKADFRVKRRWDDDVVFKNCSRSEPEKKDKIFINDSLRSEFHRRFMEKYIKWLIKALRQD